MHLRNIHGKNRSFLTIRREGHARASCRTQRTLRCTFGASSAGGICEWLASQATCLLARHRKAILMRAIQHDKCPFVLIVKLLSFVSNGNYKCKSILDSRLRGNGQIWGFLGIYILFKVCKFLFLKKTYHFHKKEDVFCKNAKKNIYDGM